MVIVRKTVSICPECLKQGKVEKLPAAVSEAEGEIFLLKECKTHGRFAEPYFSDAEMYKKFMKYLSTGTGVSNPKIKTSNCPDDCGLCPLHYSSSILANIDVTNRCNQRCWYCIPEDEILPVYENGKLKVSRAANLDKFFVGREKTIFNDAEIIDTESENIFTITNKNGRSSVTKIKKIIRRKRKEDFIKIITSNGNSVTITLDHEIPILKNDSLVKVRASGLKIGDKVMVAINIPQPMVTTESVNLLEDMSGAKGIYVRNIGSVFSSAKVPIVKICENLGLDANKVYSWRSHDSIPFDMFTKFPEIHNSNCNDFKIGVDAATYPMPTNIKISDELLKLCGYFIADGHYNDTFNIWITNSNKKFIEDVKNCAKKLGLPSSHIDYSKYGMKKAHQIKLPRLLGKIFYYNFGIERYSYNKSLPSFSFSLSTENKIKLIKALFEGDGHVSRGTLWYTTISERLVKELCYILATLGIRFRIYTREKSGKLSKHTTYILRFTKQDTEKILKLFENPNTFATPGTEDDFCVEEIKKIDRVEKSEGYAYDIEVEDNSHNFICGGAILVGNCFANSFATGYVFEPTFEQIKDMLKNLREEMPVPCPAIQFSGGEPLLRKDILDIVSTAKELGFKEVQMATNGIELAKNPGLAKQLRDAGMNVVYLKFNGVSQKTNIENWWLIDSIFSALREAQLNVVLVPTVVKGFNDHEIGDIVKFAISNLDIVRGVNFQPISFVGRIDKVKEKVRMSQRITIPEVIKMVEGSIPQITKKHWYPVPFVLPISHFISRLKNEEKPEFTAHACCGAATYIFVDDEKGVMPVTEFIDAEGLMNFLEEKSEQLKTRFGKLKVTASLLKNLSKFIDKEKAPKGFDIVKLVAGVLTKGTYGSLREFHYKSLFIGSMHFQDAWNYDLERLQRCVIHYASPDGRIIPFCAYNCLPQYRSEIEKKFSIPVKKWEKLNNKKIADDLVTPRKEVKK